MKVERLGENKEYTLHCASLTDGSIHIHVCVYNQKDQIILEELPEEEELRYFPWKKIFDE